MSDIPAIPVPFADVGSLAFVCRALKQAVETLAGQRGSAMTRAITYYEFVGLSGDVSGEAAARQAADNSLQAEIDALASADIFLQAQIDALASSPGGGVPVGAIMLIAPVYAQDLDTSGGPQTYTLRTAQDDGEQWRVKDATGNAATNPITVTAGGVILLDGTPTVLINQAFQARTFRWNATMGKWLIE